MEVNLPKVSVIIPVYNAEENLNKCLNALIKQTFRDFEVICINDGSKDKSLEILNQFALKDSRIKVFDQENSGPAKTRYNAIEKSSGNFLMFCDADDWYEPRMIEQMYNIIIKKNVDIVMCDCNIIDLANGIIQSKSSKRSHKLSKKGYASLDGQIPKYVNCVLWNKIFNRKILDSYKIQYPQKYEHDDAIFVFKYCLCAKSYYGVNKKLYNYVVGNPNSIMGKVFTKTNKKNPFDFILAFGELYSFIENQSFCNEYVDMLFEKHFRILKSYYKFLDEDLQKESLVYLQTFIKENPIVLKNEQFQMVANITSFDDFHEIMIKKDEQRITFIEQIFSIMNDEEYKVLRVFGIKIKLYRRQING